MTLQEYIAIMSTGWDMDAALEEIRRARVLVNGMFNTDPQWLIRDGDSIELLWVVSKDFAKKYKLGDSEGEQGPAGAGCLLTSRPAPAPSDGG